MCIVGQKLQMRHCHNVAVLSQDVVKATKVDDGLAGVEKRLKKLGSAIGSIEEQLNDIEATQRLAGGLSNSG
jgi:hypothetical protein